MEDEFDNFKERLGDVLPPELQNKGIDTDIKVNFAMTKDGTPMLMVEMKTISIEHLFDAGKDLTARSATTLAGVYKPDDTTLKPGFEMDFNMEILQSSEGSATEVLKVEYDGKFKELFGGLGNLVVEEPKFIVLKVYSALDAMTDSYDEEARLEALGEEWFGKPTRNQRSHPRS
ncbi:unnamed protein product [Ambrosiozyma monospora]|uniref:Unnamed protein product n=1 Tax=Ambrosiozyma monospora TaxID=43982 RepID=A0ACB5U670_AMBMO|nr:unnamed protein product [Ambrosiozyma monospora]